MISHSVREPRRAAEPQRRLTEVHQIAIVQLLAHRQFQWIPVKAQTSKWRFRKTFFGIANYSRKTFSLSDYCPSLLNARTQCLFQTMGGYIKEQQQVNHLSLVHRRGLIYNLLNNMKNYTLYPISNKLFFLVKLFFFFCSSLFF